MNQPSDLVFLFDVDNTLLDNDRVEKDVRIHLEQEFGAESRDRYFVIFEELGAELGYADYLGALQRYRLEDPCDPRLLMMSSFLVAIVCTLAPSMRWSTFGVLLRTSVEPMEFKDYYQILGVPSDADEKTIRQAFRKLAQQHHPDVNPGNKAAEEKFKEINEAYQVLSDAAQRKKYDALRTQYQQWQQRGGRPQDFDWQTWSAQPEEGVHLRYGTVDDLKDLFGSGSPFSDFFTTIFGGVREEKGAPRPRRGRDLESEIDVTLEEAFKGTKRLLAMGDRRIEANIPPGVRTGIFRSGLIMSATRGSFQGKGFFRSIIFCGIVKEPADCPNESNKHLVGNDQK